MCEPWPVVWQCDEPRLTPEVMEAATSAAQSLLNHLTGSRLGICTTTERYRTRARHACAPPVGGGQPCCRILLARRPVRRILRVEVDGVELNPASYFLDGSRYLMRRTCWPDDDPCGEARIRVTYEHGISLRGPEYSDDDPPVLIRPAAPLWGAAGLAMGELVREFGEAMCGNPCKLPSRVATVTRQGVTLSWITPEQWLKLGLVGLPATDALIRQVNPTGRRMASQVYSPDFARRA